MYLDPQIRELIDLALREDIGGGDITSNLTLPATAQAEAVFRSNQGGILAGAEVVAHVFRAVDSDILFKPLLADGDRFEPQTVLATVSGNARAVLTAERTALNFLQRLCGIATLTAAYVEAVKGYPVRIVDTRKTIPGWRGLSKYAVRVGGGANHRFGLYDAVLIKDNHIAVAGSVTAAVEAARRGVPHTMKIEVEAETLEQVEEALQAGADIILLDNMTSEQMRTAVEHVAGHALLEASGGIRLETLRAVAATGVNFISTGAITQDAPPVDISLDASIA